MAGSGTSRRGVLVWDVKAHRPRWTEQAFPTKIRPVAWRPDGAQLAGGGDDGIVYVWDAATSVLLQQLTGHRSMITSLAWSPDGTRLAASGSGKEEGELFVWEVQSGARVSTLGGYPGLVYAVTWGPGSSPGTEVVISGGGDGMLRWWDIQRGEWCASAPCPLGDGAGPAAQPRWNKAGELWR